MDGAYRRDVEAELRIRCIHLKTKEAFVGLPSEHETAFPADGPICWCDQTGEPLGPDAAPADPGGCHGASPRTCYTLTEAGTSPPSS